MKFEKLGNLATIKTGKYDVNHSTHEGEYLFFTCAIGQFKSPTYSFEGPAILLPGNGANVGEVFFYDGKFEAYQRTYVVQNFKADPNYIYTYFKAEWKNSLRNKQFGSATNYIRLNNLSDFIIPIPSLPNQLHIANLLSKAETLISQRKESIRLLDQYLKSTFLEMFGDPIRNEKGFTSITLGELFRLSSGNGLTSENMDPLGIHNVYGGNGINGKYDKFMFEEPQIVIGRVGYYCGAVHLTEPKSWVTDNALYIKELYKASNIQYLKHFLTLLKLNRVASQAAQPLISGNRLYPIKTFYPPLSLQNQFAQIVEKTEALKSQYQQSLQELENLYSSLSQKAFKGELTIKEEFLSQAAEPSMEYKKTEKF
jgi:type I restriction enzyme S subunit